MLPAAELMWLEQAVLAADETFESCCELSGFFRMPTILFSATVALLISEGSLLNCGCTCSPMLSPWHAGVLLLRPLDLGGVGLGWE